MFFSNQRSVFPDWRPVFLEVGSPLVWLYDTDVVWRCLDTVTQLLVHLEWEFNGVYMWKDGGGILLHHPLPHSVPSNKKMRRDCHSSRCWVVCFGMDLRPSDRCHDSGHMVLWFLTFKMSHSGHGLIYFSWGLSKGFLKSGRNPPTSGSHPVSLSSGFAMWMPLAATTWGITGSGLKSIQIYRRLFRKNRQYGRFGAIERYPICLKFYALDFVQNNSQRYQECSHTFSTISIMFSTNLTLWKRGLVERSVWHRGGVALCDTRLSAWVLKTFGKNLEDNFFEKIAIPEWKKWFIAECLGLLFGHFCNSLPAVPKRPWTFTRPQIRIGQLWETLDRFWNVLWSHSERAWFEWPFFVKDWHSVYSCFFMFIHDFHLQWPPTLGHYLIALIPSRVTSRLVSWCSLLGQLNQHPWAQSLCAGCFGSWSWHWRTGWDGLEGPGQPEDWGRKVGNRESASQTFNCLQRDVHRQVWASFHGVVAIEKAMSDLKAWSTEPPISPLPFLQ